MNQSSGNQASDGIKREICIYNLEKHKKGKGKTGESYSSVVYYFFSGGSGWNDVCVNWSGKKHQKQNPEGEIPGYTRDIIKFIIIVEKNRGKEIDYKNQYFEGKEYICSVDKNSPESISGIQIWDHVMNP